MPAIPSFWSEGKEPGLGHGGQGISRFCRGPGGLQSGPLPPEGRQGHPGAGGEIDPCFELLLYRATDPTGLPSLSALLCRKVFFCNSGAEANEGAIKLARKYAKEKMEGDRYEIITMERSFHGRTLATLTATAQEKYHKGYAPLVPGFKYVPFNDVEAVRKAVDSKTCAIMVEPIQGEGGVNCPFRRIPEGPPGDL